MGWACTWARHFKQRARRSSLLRWPWVASVAYPCFFLKISWGENSSNLLLLTLRPTSHRAQASSSVAKQAEQNPGAGSGVRLQKAHLSLVRLAGAALVLQGLALARHDWQNLSMPCCTIPFQTSGRQSWESVNSRMDRSWSGFLGWRLQPRQKSKVSVRRLRARLSFSKSIFAWAGDTAPWCSCSKVCGPNKAPWHSSWGEKGRATQRSSACLTRDRHM